MSRLDPSIPAGIKPAQGPDITRSLQLADIMAERADREQMRQVRQQQIEASKVQAEENRQEMLRKKKELEEDEQIRKGFDEAGGDPIKGIERAFQINPAKAMKFTKEYDDHLKSVIDRQKVEFDNHKAGMDMIAMGLSSIKANPNTKALVIKSFVTNGLMDEDEKDIIDRLSNYDPSNPEDVTFIDSLINQNTDFKTQLDLRKQQEEEAANKEKEKLEGLRLSSQTQEIDGRIKQFNTKTERYDIDLGPVTKKTDTSMTEVELAMLAAKGDPTADAALGKLAQLRKSAQTNVGGLPGQVQTKVQGLAGEFDRKPEVKQYNEAVLRYANVNTILKSKWSGPGDMAIVFEFMRALDPTSVVRESEYAEARKTGNWFKGVFARFNGSFKESGGFLSDQVKKDFEAVLKGKLEQNTKQIKNIYMDYGRRINKLTGDSDGVEYLTDYTQMLPMEGTPKPTTPRTGFRIINRPNK